MFHATAHGHHVQFSVTLAGLMMTTFVGQIILTYLRIRMNGTILNQLARNSEQTPSINSLWTIQKMLKDLRQIKLAHTRLASLAC